MRFLIMSIFFSCFTLVGCSQGGDQEDEEMEKIVQLEENEGRSIE